VHIASAAKEEEEDVELEPISDSDVDSEGEPGKASGKNGSSSPSYETTREPFAHCTLEMDEGRRAGVETRSRQVGRRKLDGDPFRERSHETEWKDQHQDTRQVEKYGEERGASHDSEKGWHS
jgi:hypothetical protein